MLSEARIGSIRCLMVRDDIHPDLCEAEQRPDACRGCTAATRRCVKCGTHNGIADAEAGLCGKCLDQEGIGVRASDARPSWSLDEALHRARRVGVRRPDAKNEEPRLRQEVTTEQSRPDELLSNGEDLFATLKLLPTQWAEVIRLRFGLGCDMLTLQETADRLQCTRQRIHQIQTNALERLQREAGIDPQALRDMIRPERKGGARSASRQTTHVPASSPLTKDPSRLYRLLMEHAAERQGAWVTPAPVTILMRRAHLMRMECHEGLSRLAADGFLTGESPWDVVTLLKTEGLAELKTETETVTARVGVKRRSRRQSPPPPARIASGRPSASLGWGTRTRPGSEQAQGKASRQEIADFLKSKAVLVSGERLVPGVVPTVQMHFRLRMPEVIAILTELEQSGFLGQKDAWRTIVLLRDDAVTEKTDVRPDTGRPSVPAPQTTLPSASRTPPAASTPQRVVPAPPPPKPAGPTYAEMYAFLVEKSSEVQGERRTGGVLPQLQIRFKLNIADATAAMGWFVANGHVAQRDGWRSVALLSTAVGSVDSPKTAALPKLPLRRPETRPTARTATANVPSAQHAVPPGADRLKTAVKALERDNEALRGQQEEITRKLRELEVMLTSLKAMQGANTAPLPSRQPPRRETKAPTASPQPPKGRSGPTRPEVAYRMGQVKLINHIREYRLQGDLTQEALAKAVGVSRQTICGLEQGDQVPGMDLAFCIAKQLGRSIEQVFELRPVPSRRR